MARRRYIIAYDISDPRRLRRVAKVMEAYGERLQYSVFLCDLSGLELARWRQAIMAEVNMRRDSVVLIDLGALNSCAPLEVLGVPRNLPPSGPTIV